MQLKLTETARVSAIKLFRRTKQCFHSSWADVTYPYCTVDIPTQCCGFLQQQNLWDRFLLLSHQPHCNRWRMYNTSPSGHSAGADVYFQFRIIYLDPEILLMLSQQTFCPPVSFIQRMTVAFKQYFKSTNSQLGADLTFAGKWLNEVGGIKEW